MPRIGSIGIMELLIILVLVLLIFGPRRLPDMAKGLGQSVREFRKGIRDMRKDIESDDDDEPAKGATVSAASAQPTAQAASQPAAKTAEAGSGNGESA